MTGRTFISAAAVAALAVALAACSSNTGVEPIEEPTETAAPTEEPTDEPTEGPSPEDAEPDDPYAIPDDIDEAYVQSVLDELFGMRTEALRQTLSASDTSVLPDEVFSLVRAAHGLPARVEYADQLQTYLANPESGDAFLSPEEMGDIRYELLTLLRADDRCIVLTGAPDLSQVAVDPGDEQWSITALEPLDPADNDEGLNPTPWVIHSGRQLTFDGQPASADAVAEATYDDLSGLLELPCGEGGES